MVAHTGFVITCRRLAGELVRRPSGEPVRRSAGEPVIAGGDTIYRDDVHVDDDDLEQTDT
jgi:hypothetical protein